MHDQQPRAQHPQKLRQDSRLLVNYACVCASWGGMGAAAAPPRAVYCSGYKASLFLSSGHPEQQLSGEKAQLAGAGVPVIIPSENG